MNLSTHKKSEVDLRIAQELKNNKDFIYQTNQSLQDLNLAIRDLSVQQAKILAKYESERKSLLIDFENLKEVIFKTIHSFNQRVGKVEDNFLSVNSALNDLQNETDALFLSKEQYVKSSLPEFEKINFLFSEINRQEDYFHACEKKLKNEFKDSIEKLESKLTPKIPEVDPIDVKLNERFNSFKVDFQGLLQEISYLKKDIAYGQKKFENIYTLIERLKAGKQ